MHFKLSYPPPSPKGELVRGFANASDDICLQLYHLKLNCDQALVSVLQAPSLGDGGKNSDNLKCARISRPLCFLPETHLQKCTQGVRL